MTPPMFTDAACVNQTHLFFASDDETPYGRRRRVAAAKRICRGCPHIDDCRQWAVDNGERGIWGGTTESERNPIVVRRPPGVDGPLADLFLADIGWAA